MTASIPLRNRSGVVVALAIVDEVDYERLIKYRWYAHTRRDGNTKAAATVHTRTGKTHLIMHRVVLDAPAGTLVDHVNHNTLDNRRANLRLVTHAENQQNRRGPASHSSTGVRGVSRPKGARRYRAIVRVGRKPIYLGYFDSIDAASRAAAEGRRRYMTHSAECAPRGVAGFDLPETPDKKVTTAQTVVT